MDRTRHLDEIGYRIEMTLLGGTLKFEQSGTISAGYQITAEDIRKASIGAQKALQNVYEVVLMNLGTDVIRKAAAKAFADGAGIKEELQTRGESAEDKWMISIAEAASLIGVSKSKMWAMVNSGQVPSATFGKLRRVPLKEFREWLDRQLTTAKEKA